MNDLFKKTVVEKTDPRFRKLLGKRVSILHPQGHTLVGILNFAGINPLHGKFQATISKMPVWPVDPKTIKEEL